MKKALSIGLLLLICVPSPIIAKRDSTFKDPKPFIDKLNSDRKNYAIKYNIANMHEISYDRELEKILIKNDCSKTNPDGDFFYVPVHKDLTKLKDSNFEGLSPEELKTAHTDWQIFMDPLKTKVACSEPCSSCHQCEAGGCLIGPLKTAHFSEWLKGPLGSKCTYGKGPSGLCLSSEQSQAIIKEIEQKEAKFSEENKTSEGEQNGAKFSEAKADIDLDKSSSCSFLIYLTIAFTFFMA